MPNEVTAHKLVTRVGQEVALPCRRTYVRDILRVESRGKTLRFFVGKGPHSLLRKGEIVSLTGFHAVGKPGGGLRNVRQFRDYRFTGMHGSEVV